MLAVYSVVRNTRGKSNKAVVGWVVELRNLTVGLSIAAKSRPEPTLAGSRFHIIIFSLQSRVSRKVEASQSVSTRALL
jgi:hypothetical protein